MMSAHQLERKCEVILSALRVEESQNDALVQCKEIMPDSQFSYDDWKRKFNEMERHYLTDSFLPAIFRLLTKIYDSHVVAKHRQLMQLTLLSVVDIAAMYVLHCADEPFAIDVLSQCVYAKVPFFAKRCLVCHTYPF